MKLSTRLKLRRCAVWVARILVGATFILSGWSKAIDPWGFLLKAGEYLAVWGLDLPREVVLTGCVALSCVEFATGILLASGSLKRIAVWTAAAMMAVMLPLTAYIYVADPVSDCGCFGDFMIISNGATFAKNVVLAGLIGYLMVRNTAVRGIYAAPIQWLVVAVSLAFPMFLAFVGYTIQPMIDFRPYPRGTGIFSGDNPLDETSVYYIYEKDGRQERFALDALPDSTWEYVDAVDAGSDAESTGIAVRDTDGYDVASEIVSDTAPQLFLIVNDPGIQFLSRSHYVRELYGYARSHGVEMSAVVAGGDSVVNEWTGWIRPEFPVYNASDTSLKQLVRGDAAIVYTIGGITVWKRNLATLDIDFGKAGALGSVMPVDNGFYHRVAVGAYVLALALIYLLSLSPKILRLFMPRKNKKFVSLPPQ